ncbi:MAG: hypothetical protein P8100_05235 [bacterium]|jgi:hypothetical protein
METVIFISTVAVYTLLFAIYFFGFKRSGRALVYSRYVVLTITVVGSLAVGYFSAVLRQTGDSSMIWGIAIFSLGLIYAVWKFVKM